MRFIPASLHGVLDYAVAAALVIGPFALGFEGFALFLGVAGGIGLFLYSLVTDYSISARKLLPFKAHLALDFIAAVALLVAPFALSFGDIATYFYASIGAAVIVVVLLTNPDTGETFDDVAS